MADGELDHDTDAEALAGHVMAVIQGLSTLARDGATREKLMRVAEMTMRAWPAEGEQASSSVSQPGRMEGQR